MAGRKNHQGLSSDNRVRKVGVRVGSDKRILNNPQVTLCYFAEKIVKVNNHVLYFLFACLIETLHYLVYLMILDDIINIRRGLSSDMH